MAITNLTGYTWYGRMELREVLTFRNSFYVNFTSSDGPDQPMTEFKAFNIDANNQISYTRKDNNNVVFVFYAADEYNLLWWSFDNSYPYQNDEMDYPEDYESYRAYDVSGNNVIHITGGEDATNSEFIGFLERNGTLIPPPGYTITYHANGGIPAPSKVHNATALPDPLPIISKSGFTFNGWFFDEELLLQAAPGTHIEDACDLYAKFTSNQSSSSQFITSVLKTITGLNNPMNQWLSLENACQRINLINDSWIGINPRYISFYFDSTTEILYIRKFTGVLKDLTEICPPGYAPVSIAGKQYYAQICPSEVMHDDAGVFHTSVTFDNIVAFHYPNRTEEVLKSVLDDL